MLSTGLHFASESTLGFGNDQSVGLLLVIGPVLQGQCHALFSFVQATGGALDSVTATPPS